jgi:Fe-S oxidoreductase
MDSPRGRIYLIKAVDEERLQMTPSFVDHMYLCLDCRACETACPSHVEFGDLMERARGQIERNLPRTWQQRWLRRLVFAHLFPAACTGSFKPSSYTSAPDYKTWSAAWAYLSSCRTSSARWKP